MKRRMNKALCVLLALILAVSLLPATALADGGTVSISGNVDVSTLPDNAIVTLTGDTKLTIDANKTIASISGASYNLEVEGSGDNRLTVNCPSGNAIEIKNITINGNLTAKTTPAASNDYSKAISIERGDVTINGGSVILSGGGSIKCDYSGAITINGGTVTAECLTSDSGALYCNDTMKLNGGTVKVTGKYGLHSYAGIDIGSGATVNINVDNWGINCTHYDVSLNGNVTVKSSSTSVAAVRAGRNIKILGGTIDITGGKQAIQANTSTQTETGLLTIDSSVVINVPIGGRISDDKETIVYEDGTIAMQVKIGQPDPGPTFAFTTQPQSGTSKKTEAYNFSWATNETPDQIWVSVWRPNQWEKVGDYLSVDATSGSISYDSVSDAVRDGVTRHKIFAKKGTSYFNSDEFTVTWTEDVTEYPVWVGSTRVTEDNKNDVLNDGGSVKYTPGEGAGTLTFTTATPTITGVHENALIYADGIDLTIKTPSAGLTLNNDTGYGVFVKGKSLTINGNITGTTYKHVLRAENDVTVTGNATLNSSDCMGIYAYNGSVNITGNAEGTSNDSVLWAYNDVTVGGTVNAKSTVNAAVYAGRGKIDITGDVTADSSSSGTATLFASKDVTIGGNAKVDSTNSMGIYASNGSISVTGDAEGTSKDAFIFANKNVEVTGKVTATSQTNATLFAGSGDITIGGGVDVTCNATNNVAAIEGRQGTVELKGNATITSTSEEGIAGDKVIMTIGKWDIEATKVAIRANTDITYPTDTHAITLPKNGEINTTTVTVYEDYTVTYYTVTESDGTTVAAHAIIEPIYTAPNPMAITVEDPENGTATASRAEGFEGSVIKITVTPDEGYEIDTVTVTDKNGNEISVHDNGDGTYTFVMPDSPVTVNVTFKESEGGTEPEHDCPSKDFRDFDPNAWYHEAVDYAVANGLMKGTSPTTFEPGTATTRAMIVTILWRLEGEPVVNSVNPFDDVEDGAWYTDAIIWAAANGIVEGYGNGKFGPNDDITREQLATMLWRYAKYKGYDVSVGEDTNIISYDDFDQISKWAVPAMQWAVGDGLIEGRTPSTIVPQGLANRAETATIFMRFIEKNK